MFKKIEKLQNLGVFNDFNWDRDFSSDDKKELKDINIIYGRNYSGKTTISRIFSSLETKKLPLKFIQPKFSLMQENNVIITEKDIETQTLDVRVFNDEFIFQNLKFLNNTDYDITPFAILGQNNNELENEINKLQEELGKNEKEEKTGLYKKAFETEIKYKQLDEKYIFKIEDLEKKMKKKATDRQTGIKYNHERFGDQNYTVAKLKKEISDIKLKNYTALSEKEVIMYESIIFQQGKMKIQNYKKPNLNFNSICICANEILSRKIGESNKIYELLLDTALNEWVRKGFELHNQKSNCAFCGNVLTDERKKLINAHFDEESRKLELEIMELIKKIDNEISNVSLSLPIDKNNFQSNFHGEIEEVENNFKTSLGSYTKQLIEIRIQLEARKKNIIKSIEFTIPKDFTKELFEIYDKYLIMIEKHNEIISKSQENKIEAQKKLRLNEIYIFSETINYDLLNNEISDIEEEKKSVSKVLNELKEKIKNKESEIELKKQQLNDEGKGADQVNEYLTNYFGHEFLKLQAEKIDNPNKTIRFNIIRNGNIAFNLSEGEKSLIAFCYFMAKLKDVITDNKKPVIWIDDPISSLDSNHIFFIYTLIRTEIVEEKKTEQLFISTHNLDFYKYLKRLIGNYKKIKVQYYMLQRIGETTKLTILPKHIKEYVTEFNFLFNEIYKCSKITVIDDSNYKSFYNFGNNARKFLEILLYYLYPDDSSQIEKLQKFFENERISAIMTDRINNEYSHLSGVFERGEIPIEVPEMLKIAKLIIDTIKLKNQDQYDALLKSIGEKDI